MAELENKQEIDSDIATSAEIDSTGWYVGIETEIAGDSDKINEMQTPTDFNTWNPHLKDL